MSTLYPILFQPAFKERVWGGRNLESLFGKELPPGAPIGESWEVSDRSGDVSMIRNGPLAGKDLRYLMEHHGKDLFGHDVNPTDRFPLLIKLLDAQGKLSLQVHPPAQRAAELKGEPKTELWYIARAEPGAELYAGLRTGVTREEFEQRLRTGDVAECFHRIPVQTGDCLFLPSGRVHAIGAGLVIFEIQQNSDTTYRVFDWNRVGLDGKARELHVEQALASIDFEDFEPRLVRSEFSRSQAIRTRYLVQDPLFTVDAYQIHRGEHFRLTLQGLAVIGMISGALVLEAGGVEVKLKAGDFCLLPVSAGTVRVHSPRSSTYLYVQPGNQPAINPS